MSKQHTLRSTVVQYFSFYDLKIVIPVEITPTISEILDSTPDIQTILLSQFT